jgi:transposase-like protein
VALVEREMIFAEIKRNNGNKSKAAKEMGISREALRKKLLLSQEVLEQCEMNAPGSTSGFTPYQDDQDLDEKEAA